MPLDDDTPKLAYTLRDAAQMTSLSERFLSKQIAAGRLQAQRVGRRVLILRAELERWLKAAEEE